MKETERQFALELTELEKSSSLRRLVSARQQGMRINIGGDWMLNLSGNDYLGLAADVHLRTRFVEGLTSETFLPSASSSRLLTGNFNEYEELEKLLCGLFGTEAALVFNSGYHMNTGILPAVADVHTLILADKLVHASIIDGIRLSAAKCIRYRHNNYEQLEQLLRRHHNEHERIIIVTESIFSMDGDEADLRKLVSLKQQYPNVMLYVDEAHGIGVRGERGLGCAEEQGCIGEIDFLCGTFGKALASVGAYVVCSRVVRDYLVNRMRTLIFTTALPPVNLQWTRFVLELLPELCERRRHLRHISILLQKALTARGCSCPSSSHIVPMVVGSSANTVLRATELQQKGFYALPVRPPTVPEGTSRIRFSLSAGITEEEIEQLIDSL